MRLLLHWSSSPGTGVSETSRPRWMKLEEGGQKEVLGPGRREGRPQQASGGAESAAAG